MSSPRSTDHDSGAVLETEAPPTRPCPKVLDFVSTGDDGWCPCGKILVHYTSELTPKRLLGHPFVTQTVTQVRAVCTEPREARLYRDTATTVNLLAIGATWHRYEVRRVDSRAGSEPKK